MRWYIKLFFSILPYPFWIALLIGIAVRFFEGDFIVLSNILIQVVAILIFYKLGIIIHETGHLVGAKIVGGQPRRMILGNGHEKMRFEILKTRIIINTNLLSGKAYAIFNTNSFIKLRYFVNITGGFMANLLLAFIIYLLFGFDFNALSGDNGVDISTAFIFSSGLLIILALIPSQYTSSGVRGSSDGLMLLLLPFRKIDKITKDLNRVELMDAVEYMESKEYDKAVAIFEKYLKYDELQVYLKINLSVIYLRKGEYQKSLEILTSIEDILHQKQNKPFTALVNNNLAWIYLLLRDVEKADKHSKVAIDLSPADKNFRNTRGAALIENGKIQNGIYHLIDLVDFKYPNSQTLSAAMYLSFGYFLQGNIKDGKKHADFVISNISKLDNDEKQVWENILEQGKKAGLSIPR